MKPNLKKYFSKLLLFGEYTVGMGGAAIAVPNLKFYGEWVLDPANQHKEGLFKLLNHIQTNPQLAELIYVSGFESAINEGWYFRSNIPLGYGLGSSGALVAALMDIFGRKHHPIDYTSQNLMVLKNSLAALECAFHGVSSGTDPLVSYLNQGIHIIDKENLQLITKPVDLSNFFLIDSKVSRSTTPLVNAYNHTFHEDKIFQNAQNKIARLNVNAINQVIQGNINSLWLTFNQISELQYESFTQTSTCHQLIDFIEPIWAAGLTDPNYAIKLCGAGGGGVYLGMALNVEDFIASHPDLTVYRLA